jgi:hypothetical protein
MVAAACNTARTRAVALLLLLRLVGHLSQLLVVRQLLLRLQWLVLLHLLVRQLVLRSEIDVAEMHGRLTGRKSG